MAQDDFMFAMMVKDTTRAVTLSTVTTPDATDTSLWPQPLVGLLSPSDIAAIQTAQAGGYIRIFEENTDGQEG